MALKGIVEGKNYTFSAANKTITFSSDYIGMSLSDITYITNIKSGVATVIYDPFDSTKGGLLNGLVLTLAYNTTSMSDSDPLQIIVGYTPKNADPQLVRIVEGPDQQDDTALLQNISDNLDFLNLALDQSEGIQVNTREANPYKKDLENAIILSDAFETKYTIPVQTTVISPIIDTKGYQSIQWQTIAGTAWSINSIQFSNDGNNWVGGYLYYYLSGTTGPFITSGSSSSGVALFYSPIQGRYVRINISNNSTTVPISMNILLRTAPFTHPVGMQASGYIATNTAQVNGSTPGMSAGTAGTAGSGVITSGGIATAGGYTPTTNPPNANTSLSTNVPWPIGVGGREWPYIGALAGIFRYLSLDPRGNILIGGDTAFRTPNMGTPAEQLAAGTTRGIGANINNINGAQSLNTADTSQVEGDTMAMMLKQILTELKILNQQITEIPFLMNAGQSKMSDPQEYRDDNSNLF